MLWTEEHDDYEKMLLNDDPIAVFGDNDKRAHILFRKLAKMFHPDTMDASYSYRATMAFEKLNAKWEAYKRPNSAETPVNNSLIINGKLYHLDGIVGETDKLKLIKVDDYILTVAREKGIILNAIRTKVCKQLFPEIVSGSLVIPQKDGNHSAILYKFPMDKLRSLKTVPKGITAKDIAWIWRRILSVAAVNADEKRPLAFNPALEFIMPETHGYLSFSGIYPGGTDNLKNAADLMLEIMVDAPLKVIRHFKAIEIETKVHPAEILIDFDKVIEAEWGKRRFHKFIYPKEW